MPSTQAVEPSPSHNRDGSEKVRTFDKRTHRHKPFSRQRFVSACGYGTVNYAILSKYELLRATARRQIGTGLFFVQTFVDFALSLPGHSLEVCLSPRP